MALRTRPGYVATVSKVMATLALLGLLTSPVVAQTRLFCKYTGVEVTDCSEQDAPAAPVVRSADCCEHRVLLPLADSRLAPHAESVLVPVFVPLPSVAVVERVGWIRAAEEEPASGAGPPLFVQYRALLI